MRCTDTEAVAAPRLGGELRPSAARLKPHGCWQTPAAGVTLLEVLFSMGIIAVGLLGILTVLPLAGLRTMQGAIADGADSMGRNAIRELRTRQLRSSEMWAQYNRTASRYVDYSGGEAFCIDPLFVSTHVANSTYTDNCGYFPYYIPAASFPRMRRISARRFPGAASTNGPLAMSFDQAAGIFLSQDDLVFELPVDRTDPPVQIFSGTRRQAEGKFSWIATVTPREDAPSGLYLVSIIVFHRRDLTMTTFYDSASAGGASPDPERVVNVAEFYSLGFGGGDVRLETKVHGNRANQNSNTHKLEDLAVRSGDWVMLSANSNAGPVFRWYRVLSVDEVLTDATASPTFYKRNVTLQGRDWIRNEWFQFASGQRTTLPSNNFPTEATLVSNVVAVYEKTIRRETSSLWASN